ncbi:MAG: DUF6516 family protein, partial [Bdellovibrionota bacterium]
MVKVTKDYPHRIKHSLFCVNLETKGVIIGFDNHRPKGPHKHMGDNEVDYRFDSTDQLLDDFWSEIKKARLCSMKLKKAKIRITSLDSIKGEWQKALKGKATHTRKDDEIIFVGIDSVAKIFSKSRIELLMAIIKSSPH